jgi:exosome complex component RRP45
MAKEGVKKDDLVSSNEREFILAAIEKGLRIDGRRPYDFRTLKITFGEEAGTVFVQLGRTRVLACTVCGVTQPHDDRPTEGFFTFNVEFSPMASPKYGSGRPSASAVEVIRIVERGLRESRAVDTEALCIIAGEKVWSIRLDVHVLDDCGNLIDACSIAAITALHHFRRPDVTICGSQLTVHPPTEKEPVPLSIHHIPICVTFGIFSDGRLLVVDPEWKEEKVQSGRITMTLNAHRELCAIQKAGGVPLSVDQILEGARIAQMKVVEITQIIQQALRNDQIARGTKKPSFLMTAGYGLQQTVAGKIHFVDSDQSTELRHSNTGPSFFPDTESQNDFQKVAEKLSKIDLVKKTEDFLSKLEKEVDVGRTPREESDSDDVVA